jgi:hypothetical protein
MNKFFVALGTSITLLAVSTANALSARWSTTSSRAITRTVRSARSTRPRNPAGTRVNHRDGQLGNGVPNLDPIRGAPCAHPVGTGLYAAGGALAEGVSPTAEEAFWRERYAGEPCCDTCRTYDDPPAYQLDWTRRATLGADFEVAEPALAATWATRRGPSGRDWRDSRLATRAAWERDGEYGFRTCAERLANADAKELFARRTAGVTSNSFKNKSAVQSSSANAA